jgi:hypothetical protein
MYMYKILTPCCNTGLINCPRTKFVNKVTAHAPNVSLYLSEWLHSFFVYRDLWFMKGKGNHYMNGWEENRCFGIYNKILWQSFNYYNWFLPNAFSVGHSVTIAFSLWIGQLYILHSLSLSTQKKVGSSIKFDVVIDAYCLLLIRDTSTQPWRCGHNRKSRMYINSVTKPNHNQISCFPL